MSVKVKGCWNLLYSNHSPGGQRLNRGQANFLRRGEQRAAQTKSGSERPLYKTGKLAYPCRTPPGLNEILNPRADMIESVVRLAKGKPDRGGE